MQTPTFYRAVVEVAGQSLKLEWAHDSAFRFFPVERDEFCGYRLHPADAAVNKMLAMAGRVEVRDCVDVLHLDAEYLSLGGLAWAACGKDPGLPPTSCWIMPLPTPPTVPPTSRDCICACRSSCQR